MSRRTRPVILASISVLILNATVIAGMPAPLPTEYEQVFRLTDAGHERLQAISFFVVGVLAAAGVVQFLWNSLRKDLARLPRLSYPKALCGVILWGLLSVVVLTMISGARELMTPGAWQKQGFTYRLAEGSTESPVEAPASGSADDASADDRRRNLEELRTALWQFAALHEGRFPERRGVPGADPAVWSDPRTGQPYLYSTGLSADTTKRLLACEPESGRADRWVLLTNGDLALVSSAEVDALWNGGSSE
jgi:hypothetical protein